MQLPLITPRPFTGKPLAVISLFDLTGEMVKPKYFNFHVSEVHGSSYRNG